MSTIDLFHTGFQIIKTPDITAGRKNADFGQGFYLSENEEFSKRWARVRKGFDTFINYYELNTDGLSIKRLSKNEEWFDYISANRNGGSDAFSRYDVITGPIANDTIYDMFGIITSGLLKKEIALSLLSAGPEYSQTVIKSEKAVSSLHFSKAEKISESEIAQYRQAVREEERLFQEQVLSLSEYMSELL